MALSALKAWFHRWQHGLYPSQSPSRVSVEPPCRITVTLAERQCLLQHLQDLLPDGVISAWKTLPPFSGSHWVILTLDKATVQMAITHLYYQGFYHDNMKTREETLSLAETLTEQIKANDKKRPMV